MKIAEEKTAKFEALDKIGWDFAEALTNNATNAMHPYPAKFIPQIPRNFIRQLSDKGDTVYDPFLGSGTTAVEANILGRDAIGNDVNELAVLISKVKTTPIPNKKFLLIDDLLHKIYIRIDLLYSGGKKDIKKPDIMNLNMWFEDFVIDELAIIKEEVEKLNDQDLINFCYVSLSGVIINVSKQDSDTRYVRVQKTINYFDTYNKFSKRINKLRKIIASSNEFIKNGKSVFKVADTRIGNIFEENSADLSVTSPPYPNAYDYHLYHKYRLFWLGMNPHKLRRSEIGAHADYSKKNGPNEFDFMKDMEKCLLNTANILKRNGYLVFVIGDSILKGRNIKNNEILKQAALNTDFNFVTEYSRNLKSNRKSFNPKIGNIKTEKILIFKNLK
ncbi:DNA methyltransferase [Candidatus Spongiihabitans sp.]|uniref:DNA methyltransferase n=1 Tax=Candidatus Spongiihabitans sp. TaxID=3101308 RepID=UPI003C7BB376